LIFLISSLYFCTASQFTVILYIAMLQPIRLKQFLFTIGVLLFSCTIFAQVNIYVSAQGGNDITGSGSISSPYATIDKAVTIATTPANSSVHVTIWLMSGVYRNPSFSTPGTLPIVHDPQNAGEAIWKTAPSDEAIRLANIERSLGAELTIRNAPGESPLIEGDSDIAVSIRNCAYINIEGLEIRGVVDRIPKQLAWLYWGTYRTKPNTATVYTYGDRKTEICATYGIGNCSGIPPNVFLPGVGSFPTYSGLPNINAASLNLQRPGLFGGKGLLVQLSHHINITDCNIHHFPGGGLRVTASDWVEVKDNEVHHNSSRASVGTHGLVIEGLSDDSGISSSGVKMLISGNIIHSNYNEIYSWVQSKTIVTTEIDEGKGVALLRTSPAMSSFNGKIRVENNIAYNNGKSGIHTNDVDNAEIFNNTVYNNGYTNIYDAALSAGTNAGISVQNSGNIQINNNIVTVPTGLTPALVALAKCQSGCSTVTTSNNLIQGGGNEFGTGAITANPMFVNVSGNNVALQATSPAINASSTVSGQFSTTDFTGSTRVGVADIGAFEYFGPLPVELLNLTGVATKAGNALKWTTGLEQNVKEFTLERSTDGQTFSELTTLSAKGSNSTYIFTDIDAQPIAYYRLKMTDLDLSSAYSQIVSLRKLGARAEFTVYPNPVSQSLNLDITTTEEQEMTIEVLNITGQLAYQSATQLDKGYNQFILDLSNLPNGMYTLRTRGAGQDVQTFKVSKI
jgi:parallel beta-helix repeat protein